MRRVSCLSYAGERRTFTVIGLTFPQVHVRCPSSLGFAHVTHEELQVRESYLAGLYLTEPIKWYDHGSTVSCVIAKS